MNRVATVYLSYGIIHIDGFHLLNLGQGQDMMSLFVIEAEDQEVCQVAKACRPQNYPRPEN